MRRSLRVVLAGVASAVMVVWLGTGVAAADKSTGRHHRLAPGPSQVNSGPDIADTDESQLTYLHHLTTDPNGRKQLFNLLRHSI